MEESITPLSREGMTLCPTPVIGGDILTPLERDWWRDGSGEYKRNGGSQGKATQPVMERQATQPAAMPSGRKRRRVSGKKKDEEEKAQDWVRQVSEPLTPPAEKPARTARFYELLDVYKQDVHNQVDMPVTEEWLERQYGHLIPPSTPVYHSIEALLEGVDKLHQEPTHKTLKDYEEVVVDEGPLIPDPSREEVDLDTMDTNLNDLLYQTCPFHPHQFMHCINPDMEFGQLRYKCPQEGCPVHFFEDTRQVILEKLNYETHPQVRAKLKQGSLTCKCRFTPKMKLSRKVFFSCGKNEEKCFRTVEPCGYFQWLHGPLWQPREQAQPTLKRWVKETPIGHVPCTPRLWRTQTQHPVVDKAPPNRMIPG